MSNHINERESKRREAFEAVELAIGFNGSFDRYLNGTYINDNIQRGYERFIKGVEYREERTPVLIQSIHSPEVSRSFEWVEAYKTEDELEYRIPAYKAGRFRACEQFYLEKISVKDERIKKLDDFLLEIRGIHMRLNNGHVYLGPVGVIFEMARELSQDDF